MILILSSVLFLGSLQMLTASWSILTLQIDERLAIKAASNLVKDLSGRLTEALTEDLE